MDTRKKEISRSNAGSANYPFLAVLILTLALFVITHNAVAADACVLAVAQVVSVQGIVEVRRAQTVSWKPVELDTPLCVGDSLRVRKHSRAALRLMNDSLLRLDQRTAITFPPSPEADESKVTSFMGLIEGAIHILTRTPQPFKINTPFLNAVVDGTEFFIGVQSDHTRIVMYEGRVSASNKQGSLVLTDHEAALAYKNQPPQKEIVVQPLDAVQWALYYPAIIGYHHPPLSDHTLTDTNTRKLLSEAEYLLSVGQANEANHTIRHVLEIDPGNSDALALQAIIAVVQNDKNSALELAAQAVTQNDQSVPARLALSYAQQADFKIEDALKSVEQAAVLDPQNALIWARLSELHMSLGELDQALQVAQEAVNLNPTIAKTQTVLGFAYLLQINTTEAKFIFTKAILLDQTDPMPRLGLGLALIREGQLEAGRIELEIAVSLDPANSLMRSYLGKAYFEEKRYPLAGTQFDMAKERDPYDPTPWFYDAIQKQTQNRPVEALQDIQKSIELNDNRAVYRSKLLLDQDQAGRGSSLARIYDNLGFEKRAIMETAKSLSYDPSNHSAHRFLSDIYINTPQHEIARVSELLQAQLLQPLNVNPVQPHLAIADLNIITNTGPTSTGFNEFAPLMERNKPQLVASGIVGSQGTLGNELVFSQLYDRTSVSLGQFHHETNGFRENYDQKHNIYNAFIQHAFTPKLNMQVEVRTRESEFGDLILDEDQDNFDKNAKQTITRDSARVGARYALSPQQDIIASYINSGRKVNNSNDIGHSRKTQSVDILTVNKLDETGYLAEIQHLFRKDFFNVITGFSTYQIDVDRSEQTDFSLLNDPNLISSPQRLPGRTNERNSGYVYTNLNFLKKINATLGLSYISLQRGDDLDVNKFNPKFGLQLDITHNLRLRMAWLETIKSTRIADQTIEPSQVAGFNQLFDDFHGTKSRRKGIGLDAVISPNIYAGIEASMRNLATPLFDRPTFNFQKQKEELYRTYLYWLPQKNWSIRGEAQYEKYTRNVDLLDDPVNDPTRIENLSLPLEISYFDQRGYLAKLTGTYVLQDIKRQESHTLKAGTHDFFMLDTSVGYRLPKRKGLISFEVRNLLNQDFTYRSYNFQLNQYRVSRYIPERAFFARLILNF